MRYAGLAALALLVLVGWAYTQRPENTKADDIQQTQTNEAPVKHNTSTHKVVAKTESQDKTLRFVTGLEQLAPSLKGTEVDGGFELDEAGDLLPSFRTRQLFDYFLSAQGEEELSTILARIEAYIHHQLPNKAAAEAVALLHNYVGFLAAADGLEGVKPAMDTLDLLHLREQKQAIASLRYEYLDAATQSAFFGAEDAYDHFAFGRLEVLANEALSAEEKAHALNELKTQMPTEFQQEQEQLYQLQTLQTLTQEWQQQGGDPQELQQLRHQLVGEEATQRLEGLDKERQQWQQRVDEWLDERQRILANGNLSPEDKDMAIEELRASRFSQQEALRVKFAEKR